MRKFAPVFLATLILSDAFLKQYIHKSPALQSVYPILFTAGLLILLASSLYFFAYFRKSNEWESITERSKPSVRAFWIAASIILFGAILRFWRLEGLFDGVFWDEAYKGLDAIAIREYGERPIFLNWNAGREALVAYLVAGFSFFTGYSGYTVRAVEATAGVATLVFFYLFVRQIFNHKIALLSLFLFTVSKYHIIYSRYGLRVNLILLFETATLYFLARGINVTKNRYAYFVLAGLAGGLGFYTYIPYRIFPLVVLAFLLDRGNRIKLRANIAPLAAALVVSAIVVAPLAQHYIENRQSFTDRMARTAVWATTKKTEPKPLPVVLFVSAQDTLAMWTFKGDSMERQNVGEEQALSSFSTAFFLLGFVLFAANFRKPYAPFFLVYFFIGVLPAILAESAPHASRNLGALPAAIVFTSFGILTAIRFFSQLTGRILFMIVISGNLITGPVDGLFRYSAILDRMSPGRSALWGMDIAETDIGHLLNQLGDGCEAYLSPQLFFHATIELLTYKKSEHQLWATRTVFPHDKIVLIFLQTTPRNLWWLRDAEGKDFFKWWRQRYKMDRKFIKLEILRIYGNHPQMTRQSDLRLLNMLREQFPSGKVVHFDSFTIFMINETTDEHR